MQFSRDAFPWVLLGLAVLALIATMAATNRQSEFGDRYFNDVKAAAERQRIVSEYYETEIDALHAALKESRQRVAELEEQLHSHGITPVGE